MVLFNVFRIMGDLAHIASKLVLMWSIHWNRSAEGVSLITQVLYCLVFGARYLDIFSHPIFEAFIWFYLFAVKLFYIGSSVYIVFLMTFVYARTREREKAWKFGIYCLIGAVILATPVCKIFEKGPVVKVGDGNEAFPKLMYAHEFKFTEILWCFSEILESVAVLPQLLLLRQTNVPTVIDSYYLTLLGSYRAFYILNWIVRFADSQERHFDPVAVIFGIVQTALYVDFAWVYYSRQRVKLRAGGIVDSDDLERGWLVGRLAGKRVSHDGQEDDDIDGQENGVVGGRKWGPRGISVSADEGLFDDAGEDARPLADPAAFEDDLTDDEAPPPATGSGTGKGKSVDKPSSPWADDEGESTSK